MIHTKHTIAAFVFIFFTIPLMTLGNMSYQGPTCEIIAEVNNIEKRMTKSTMAFSGGSEPFPYYLADVSIIDFKPASTNYDGRECTRKEDINRMKEEGIIIKSYDYKKLALQNGDVIKGKAVCGGGTMALDGCFLLEYEKTKHKGFLSSLVVSKDKILSFLVIIVFIILILSVGVLIGKKMGSSKKIYTK